MEGIKFKINQYGFDLNEKSIGEVFIKKEYTDLWYKEMMRRFNELCILKTEEEKQEFLEKTGCYDIDESRECGEIGLPHLLELLTFIKNG